PRRFPAEDHGPARRQLRADDGRPRRRARAGVRSVDDRVARIEQGLVPQRDRRGAGAVARAARKPVPRARDAPDGQRRPLTLPAPIVRRLGRLDYERAEPMMRSFTDARSEATPDEIWL